MDFYIVSILFAVINNVVRNPLDINYCTLAQLFLKKKKNPTTLYQKYFHTIYFDPFLSLPATPPRSSPPLTPPNFMFFSL